MGNYKQNRKPKLSDPRDTEFFPKTYLRLDAKGTKRRYLDGHCEVCGEAMTMTWSNFSHRKNVGRSHTFMHKHCSDAIWREELKRQRLQRPESEVYRLIYRKYIHGAKARGHEFRLPFEDFCVLIQQNCLYCGNPPRPHDHWQHVNYNGIDRADNSVGYILSNSVPCCTECNFYKRDTPLKTWTAFLERVRRHG